MFYRARDLAGLPGMPNTHESVKGAAHREKWDWCYKVFPSSAPCGSTKEKVYSFSSLPKETQNSLRTPVAIDRMDYDVEEMVESLANAMADIIPMAALNRTKYVLILSATQKLLKASFDEQSMRNSPLLVFKR